MQELQGHLLVTAYIGEKHEQLVRETEQLLESRSNLRRERNNLSQSVAQADVRVKELRAVSWSQLASTDPMAILNFLEAPVHAEARLHSSMALRH